MLSHSKRKGTMKKLKYVLSALLLSTGVASIAQTNPAVTNKIVADKNYVFTANSALPMANAEVSKVLNSMQGGQGGGSITLTGSQYDLVVTKDSLKAYLPYYGRSYSAPVNPSDGGIKFTSKDFSYKQTRNKKGVYAIQIETKDVKFENYRMTINISENGYASLVVSSINKQPITFNGSVDEVKSK